MFSSPGVRPNVEVPGLFLGSPDRLFGRSLDALCCVFVIVWMVQGGPSDFIGPCESILVLFPCKNNMLWCLKLC